MNREQFLKALASELRGLAPRECDEILADYQEYFRDATAAGRSEEDIAQSLGSPRQLARELRAQARIKDWETQKSPGSFARMLLAVAGLGLMNMMVLPLLIGVAFTLLALFFAAFALILSGLALVLSTIPGMGLTGLITVDMGGVDMVSPISIALAGIGVFCSGVVWFMVNGWLSKWFGRGLVRYARLNFRVVRGES